MIKLFRKRSKKAGLPPGTLVHIGEKKVETPKITVFDYDEAHFEEKEATTIDECLVFRDKPTVTWINVAGIHDLEILEKLGDCFGLHPLVLEDILNTEQHPKLEQYDDYLFMVLKMFCQDGENDELVVEQVSIVVGPNFVISFQESDLDVFTPVRERIRNEKGRMRKQGADYLAYALVDAVVDGYFVVLETLGDRIEDVEEGLLANPTPQTVQAIHELKRELIFLRKSVWPLREVIGALERGESALITKTTLVYLRDVYDHTIQVIDTVETLRDMVSGMLDIYLSSISNRMNEIMKVLTIIATIFIPLTFLAGIYGMNFRYMPELGWHWSYPVVLGVMTLIGIAMLFFFRRKGWL